MTLTLTFRMGQGQRPYATFYVSAIAILALSVAFARYAHLKVHDFDLNGSRSNVNMPIKRPYMQLSVLAMIICVISVIVCEIFTYKLLNVLDSNR